MRPTTPSNIQIYSGGAKYSVNAQIVALIAKDSYLDALNMRFMEDQGSLSMVKIKGEFLKYAAIYNQPDGDDSTIPENFACIWGANVAGHLFEIWVDEWKVDPAFFRIDGQIVARAAAIPFTIDNLIQGDKNDGSDGEVFITDFNVPPHIYSIKDLFENSGYNGVSGLDDGSQTATTKYYAAYNVDLFTINLLIPADHPIFVAHRSVTSPPNGAIVLGDNKGLNAGSYIYYIRGGDTSGNRSNWSEGTPAIPVPKSFSEVSDVFGTIIKVLGADDGIQTAVGNWIKFRVTNLLNYTLFEIRRTRYDAATIPYGGTGVEELIYEGALVAGQISVISIFDTGQTGTPLTVDDTDQLAAIDAAKGIRYFDNALYLGNVKFASRKIEDSDIEYTDEDDRMIPVTKYIGGAGHYNSYNSVYYRTYMNRERYGFALGFRDGFSSKAQAKSTTGASALYPALGDFNNFTMPSRRDKAESESILDPADQAFGSNSQFATTATFEATQPDIANDPRIKIRTGTAFDIKKNSYHVLHPISEGDNQNDHGFRVNQSSSDVGGSNVTNFGIGTYSNLYYALGMQLSGLSKYPSWAAAVTVLQTPPAGRVVCQGVGMYALSPSMYGASKDKDSLWFWSPDFENGLVDPLDVIANPSNYEVMIMSGLGLHSEVYNGTSVGDVDFVSYARIAFELALTNANFNYGDTDANVGETGGYVSHRKWRNQSAYASVWDGADKGNKVFSIDTFSIKESTSGSPNLRSNFYILKLTEDIYNYDDAVGDQQFNETGLRNFHEPVFIVQILRKGAQVDINTNEQLFVPTPAYLKFHSIVARQGDYPLSNNYYLYELVDERPEDCITDNSNDNKYIYIRDAFGNEQPWLNVGSKSQPTIDTIFASFGTNGYYDVPAGKRVYGVYGQSFDSDTGTHFLKFGDLWGHTSQSSFYIPVTGYLIVVRYDDRYPINVFGGECFHGETVFSPIDGRSIAGETSMQFELNIGMPYYNFRIAPNYKMLGNIVGGSSVSLDFIRQWLVMFCCTSRMMMPYTFNGTSASSTTQGFSFPKVHYVLRPLPNDYDVDKTLDENDIDSQYATDFPELVDDTNKLITDIVNLGGFRFEQGIDATNLQYSQRNNNIVPEQPHVGFVELAEQPTALVWSRSRETNAQDSPNLRSFPFKNYRTIKNRNGRITKLWSAWSDDGDNLYAFTETGFCLLLTNKFQIQEGAGAVLAIIRGQGSESIMQELWLGNDNGLPDEMWRTFVEIGNKGFYLNNRSAWKVSNNRQIDIGEEFYHSRIYQDMIRLMKPQYYDGVTAHYNILNDEYWVLWKQKTQKINIDEDDVRLAPSVTINPHTDFLSGIDSVYDSLMYEVVVDSSGPYYGAGDIFLPKSGTGILSVIVKNICGTTLTIRDGNSDTAITNGALTNGQSKKYVRTSADSAWVATLLTIDPVTQLQKFMFVFHEDEQKPAWVGKFSYDHDFFVAIDNKNYGMKDGKTFELGTSGYMINDETLIAELLGTCIGEEPSSTYEFWYARINNQMVKPTSLLVYDTLDQERNNLPQGTMTAFANRSKGWETYIVRKTTGKDRMQGLGIIYKIKEQSTNDFQITSTQIWFKKIK